MKSTLKMASSYKSYKDSIITERIKRDEITVIDPIDISQSTIVIAKEITI